MSKHERQLSRVSPFRDLRSPEYWSAFRDFPLSHLMNGLFDRERAGAIPDPAVDVTETDKQYLVSAELPGVKHGELTVECQSGTLTIRGEKKSEREEKTEQGRLLERRYGAFSRSLALPEDADADQIRATFKDGVLRLEIPKRPESKPRTIAVKN